MIFETIAIYKAGCAAVAYAAGSSAGATCGIYWLEGDPGALAAAKAAAALEGYQQYFSVKAYCYAFVKAATVEAVTE